MAWLEGWQGGTEPDPQAALALVAQLRAAARMGDLYTPLSRLRAIAPTLQPPALRQIALALAGIGRALPVYQQIVAEILACVPWSLAELNLLLDVTDQNYWSEQRAENLNGIYTVLMRQVDSQG